MSKLKNTNRGIETAITTPSQFSEHIEIFKSAIGADLGGLTLVPQEGPKAGVPLSWPEVQSLAEPAANSVLKQLSSLSDQDNEVNEENDIYVHAIRGKFRVPIGYVWFQSKYNYNRNWGKLLATSIASHVEKSKKSRLHETLSSQLPKVANRSKLFNQVAKTIQEGLFCSTVLTWSQSEGGYKSRNEQGWDLIGNNNMVGKAFNGEEVVVHSIDKFSKSEIFYIEKLRKNQIKSFFLMPLTRDFDRNPTSVVGVFYNRIGGATDVDIEMIRYISSYFIELLTLYEENMEMNRKLHFFDPILEIYNDITACMVELHSLSPAFVTIISALNSLKNNFGHLIEDQQDIVSGLDSALKGKALLERHAKAFASAAAIGDEAALPESENHGLIKRNTANFFQTLKWRYEPMVLGIGGTIELNTSKLPEKIRIEEKLVDLIFENIISNATHSMSQLVNGKRTLSISVTAEFPYLKLSFTDTGVGIEPWMLPHVFTKGVTSKKKTGSGVGLALVWAIGKYYGREPTVSSTWGEGAKLNVWIKPTGEFDGEGRRNARA